MYINGQVTPNYFERKFKITELHKEYKLYTP